MFMYVYINKYIYIYIAHTHTEYIYIHSIYKLLVVITIYCTLTKHIQDTSRMTLTETYNTNKTYIYIIYI